MKEIKSTYFLHLTLHFPLVIGFNYYLALFIFSIVLHCYWGLVPCTMMWMNHVQYVCATFLDTVLNTIANSFSFLGSLFDPFLAFPLWTYPHDVCIMLARPNTDNTLLEKHRDSFIGMTILYYVRWLGVMIPCSSTVPNI